MIQAARQLARAAGLGRLALKIRHARDVGPNTLARARRNELRLLPRIYEAPPLEARGTDFMIHMLLNHARRYEGAWAIYSFIQNYSGGVGVCIHSDGTLQEGDKRRLKELFRGALIIERTVADEQVNSYFRDRGLRRCAKFRDGLVLALKLFDPVVFARSRMQLILDSDILFFSRPYEIENLVQSGRSGFSVDFGFEENYCANVARAFCPPEEVIPVNSGVVVSKTGDIDLDRVETTLKNASFWEGDAPNWFAEQALFGVELNLLGSTPLSEKYAIIGRRLNEEAVSIHFCSSAARRRLYYSDGLPVVARAIGLPI